MRLLKVLSIALATAFLVAFAYANVRHVSPSEKLKEVKLATFVLSGSLSAEEKNSLEQTVSHASGVTSCSINPAGTTASVIFYPDRQNIKKLAGLLSNNNQLHVSKKEVVASAPGGCPVHAVSSSFAHVVSVLDLRN